ncbi:MAG: HAMP domain-containing protein [Candidatus Nanohalobium sp.]
MELKRSKLLVKIVALTSILIIASLAIFSAVTLNSERKNIEEDIMERGMIFAEFSAPDIYQNDYLLRYRNAQSEEDFNRFERILEQKLDRNEDVAKVSLIGVNGRILFDSSELKSGEKYSGPSRYVQDASTLEMLKSENITYRDIEYQGEKATEIFVPVGGSNGKHFAMMRYIITYESLEKRMNGIIKQTFFSLILALIASLALAVPFSLKIANPIIELKESAEKVREGDLETEVEVNTGDEIEDLADSFNEMTEKLKRSREKLNNHRSALQKSVASINMKVREKEEEIEEKEEKIKELKSKLEEERKK